MSAVRMLALEGVHNFRDFGDWRTLNGGRVTPGKLFRSGHLSRSTQKDLSRINALGIKTLADLRQPTERQREPNTLPADPPPTILQTRQGGYDEAPHLQFLREGNLSKKSVHDYMLSAYQRIPLEPHHQHIFAQVFTQMQAGEPVLIHCAAGKDRTGILAALILTSLGVDREQVFEDYMLTNMAVDIDGLLPSIAKRISAQTGEPIEPEALRPMLGVEADFLQAALTTIGPIEPYFENVLGVTASKRQALKSLWVQ
jgi:protein-tyrosine phosphatase